jgi:hypothetical protein
MHVKTHANAGCRYCARLQQASFWGGEVEILVLSRMLRAPIYVYRSAQEAGRCGGFPACHLSLSAQDCPCRKTWQAWGHAHASLLGWTMRGHACMRAGRSGASCPS